MSSDVSCQFQDPIHPSIHIAHICRLLWRLSETGHTVVPKTVAGGLRVVVLYCNEVPVHYDHILQGYFSDIEAIVGFTTSEVAADLGKLIARIYQDLVQQTQHSRSQQNIMHISWGLLYLTPCCKGGVANSIVHSLAPQHVSAIVFTYIRIRLFIVPVNVGNSFSRKFPHPLTFCVFEHSNPGKSCHCVTCVKYKRCEPPSEMDLVLTHLGQAKMAAVFRRHFHMQFDQKLCISKTKTLIGICYQRSNWQ